MLFRYCFDVLLAELKKEPMPIVPSSTVDISSPLFVTWKKVADSGGLELRGCIGNFGSLPLVTALKEYSLVSSMRDSRFKPIRLDEVPALHVGLSFLQNFEYADDIYDWNIGVHGIQITFNDLQGKTRSATYLPEVTLEQRWSKREAVESLVRKAGFRGDIDNALLGTISLERYQSVKASMSYEQYLINKKW